MRKFDFTKQKACQDMICLIMKEKNMTKEDAVSFSINKDIARRILQVGWQEIALHAWGHADPERKWNVLDNPIIEINISDDQKKLIDLIRHRKEVTTLTAIAYFLLFTMDELGYHI